MDYKKRIILALCLCLAASGVFAFTIGRLKYKGGGDWYNDPTVITEVAQKITELTGIELGKDQKIVQFEDDSVFETPFIFVTGHGNIKFAPDEREKLRTFLKNGGFMYVDDDYGLDKHFRREIEDIFGKDSLKRLPDDFELFTMYYDFSDAGLPKIHEHYKGPPETYGVWVDGRVAIIYTYNSNISDGWTEVHKDPEPIRKKAFEFGVNLILFFLTR